ncbi:MAG: S-layer homology domain-containing protein [Oscillospiraceae bacterium]|nr:S-layer homology domain-containing protein [Oscillospiraceae bacterium]
MKQWIRKCGVLGLVLALFFSQAAALPYNGVEATDPLSYGEIETIEAAYIPGAFQSQGLTAKDKASFLQLILEQMLARKQEFSVTYQGKIEDVYTTFQTLLDEVYAVPSARSDAQDYLKYSCEKLSVKISYNAEKCVFHFTISYFTDAQQEAYVAQRVKEIIRELNVANKSDLEKVIAVHSYICSHFQYDNTLRRYSAYDGLYSSRMVCQGYALLFYRMMRELNVPVRIISGKGGGEDHAWNIVRLNGKWYNVDETWDTSATESTVSMAYFLKNASDFPRHTRDAQFETAAFLTAHPMATSSYDLSGHTAGNVIAIRLSGISTWHEEEVGQFAQINVIPLELMNQYQKPITRGEFIAILYNLCDKAGVSAQGVLCPFLDVENSLYQRQIAGAWSLGLTVGKTKTTFCPDDVLTRQEAVKMLCSALEKIKGISVPLQGYAPVSYADAASIGTWAMPYVSYAAKYQIMNGDGRSFFPTQKLTREQGMAIVWRLSQQFSLLDDI